MKHTHTGWSDGGYDTIASPQETVEACEDFDSLYNAIREIGPFTSENSGRHYVPETVIADMEFGVQCIQNGQKPDFKHGAIWFGNRRLILPTKDGIAQKYADLIQQELSQIAETQQTKQSSAERPANSVESTIREQLRQCESFEDLFVVLDNAISNEAVREAFKERVKEIKDGKRSIYEVEEYAGIRGTLHRLIETAPDKSYSADPIDTRYVISGRGQSPDRAWIRTAGRGSGWNFAAAMRLFGNEVGEWDSNGYVQKLAANPNVPKRRVENIDGDGPGVVMETVAPNGKRVEVAYGSRYGSNGRGGFGFIRPLE